MSKKVVSFSGEKKLSDGDD